jgi:hypothetical protein
MAPSASVCPYCYHTIDKNRLAFRCTGRGDGIKTPCRPERDETRDLTLGLKDKSEVLPSFVLADGMQPEKGQVRCPRCNDKTGVRVCPSCHTPLPSGLTGSGSPLIGMVGAKQTGKTVFMTVLLHQLQNGVARRYDAAVDIVGDMPDRRSAATAWTMDLERPLFRERRMVEATRQGADGRQPPYVVQWRQSRRFLFLDRTKTMAMSFYDQSGEDLTRQDTVNAHHYLSAASGLMVLLDPLQLPMVRDEVVLPERAVNAGGEPPISVLSRVTELLRSSHGVPAKKKVQIPLAVVFSKVDALFPVLGEGHPIRQVNGHGPTEDDASVHEHVRGLLHRWGADNVDAHLRLNYSSFRYFAVSALGAPPREDGLAPGDIRPLRVEEPLLWLMQTLGLIKTVKTAVA